MEGKKGRLGRFVLVCVLCISLVTGLALIIQMLYS